MNDLLCVKIEKFI